MTRQKILYDTDPGVDDALALLYLHRHPELEIVGITTVYGNAPVSITTRNARFLAKAWGIGAPVYPGASASLDGRDQPLGFPTHIHGRNGLGDYPVEGEPRDEPDTAARFIVDTVRAHPGEVRILAVAPLTNLARALELDPGIAGMVRDVVVMGGAFETFGNKSPAAEANIQGDPIAADRVFAADWPVVAVPLNLTRTTVMTREHLEHLARDANPALRMVEALSQDYIDFYRETGADGMMVHDCSAAVYLTDPQLFETRSGPIAVVEHGPASGLTFQRPDGMGFPDSAWERRRAQLACLGGDAAAILRRIDEICGGPA